MDVDVSRVPNNRQSYKTLAVAVATGGLAALLVIGLVMSIRSTYRDTTSQSRASAQRINIPEGTYSGVAWLDEGTLAFLYDAPDTGIWNTKITIYSLSSGVWREIAMPEKPECRLTRPYFIKRLPTSDLGFIFHCVLPETSTSSEQYSLYLWEQGTERVQLLYNYPDNFKAAQFTFAPGITNLIQEQARGPGLNNELYRINPDGQSERLFATWQRVRSPAWSPDGKVLAFAGTRTYQERTPLHPLFGFGPTRDLLLFPWSLYLQNRDGGEPRTLLTGIEGGFINGWSPDGKMLSFTGGYQRTEGTWIIDVETRQITRIWPVRASSAWSSDGSSIALIDHDDEDTSTDNQVLIINVPNCEGATYC